MQMSTANEFVDLIKAVGEECGYEVYGSELSFEVYTEFEHPISFMIKENSEGYLQVHIWEDAHKREKNHKYGKARYSLRSALDVVQFCNTLKSSFELRARRVED